MLIPVALIQSQDVMPLTLPLYSRVTTDRKVLRERGNDAVWTAVTASFALCLSLSLSQ